MARKPQEQIGDGLFTLQDYNTLRAHRRNLSKFLETATKAEACGVSCDFIRQQRDQTDQQLAMIEQHFMTPAPKQ